MTISDIEKLPNGSTLSEISGKCIKTYEPKGKGPWNLVVEDATGSIRVCCWTQDNLKDLYNQQVVIRGRGPKDLTVKYSDFSKKNEVSVSKNCGIFGGTEVPSGSSPSSSAPSSARTVADARRAIFQAAQLMVECIKASSWINEQISGLTPEQLQAIGSSLFISADRAGFAKAFPELAKKPIWGGFFGSVLVPEKAPATPAPKKEDEDELGW